MSECKQRRNPLRESGFVTACYYIELFFFFMFAPFIKISAIVFLVFDLYSLVVFFQTLTGGQFSALFQALDSNTTVGYRHHINCCILHNSQCNVLARRWLVTCFQSLEGVLSFRLSRCSSAFQRRADRRLRERRGEENHHPHHQLPGESETVVKAQ